MPKLLRLLIPLLTVGLLPLAAAEVARITPADAAAQVQAGTAVLVDVREPAEWADTGVATPAVLLPKSDFDGDRKLWAEFLAKTGDQPIILYCRSGKRAATVGAALAAQGRKVANAGGLQDWIDAGLPTRPATAAEKK